MKFFLLSVVSLVCAAAIETSEDPPKTVTSTIPNLSGSDFQTTVKNGSWFVKFFSPYCGHCKKFQPHWEKAGEKYESYDKLYDFHLASVDCSLEGDLCSKQDIKGYPTMWLFKDGQKATEYLNVQVSDPFIPLSDFIDKHHQDSYKAASEVVSQAAQKISSTSAVVAQTKPTDAVLKGPPKGIPEGGVASNALPTKEQLDQKHEKVVSKPKDEKTFTNPSGTSVELKSDSFNRLVSETQDGWFIKFYAPWCGHCQAMAPAWSELANDFRGKLNIGEVNCEAESRLCKDAKVRGYPTLLFFKGGEHIEYSGLRGLGDLMSFATKAVSAGVKDVDAADFEAIQKKEEVIFLYFYDQATTTEDFEALQRTSLELIGHAPLLKTSSSILASKFRASTFPKLTVIRDGKPQYYMALGPKDMRDHKKILAWMKSAWLPIVPELSAENSHEIMQRRVVVLAALDPASKDFEQQKAMLKDVAHEWTDQRAAEDQQDKQLQRDKKQEKIEIAESKGDKKALEQAKGIQVRVEGKREVGFAWVNGVFWQKWLAAAYNINVEIDGPRVIINEEDAKQFWDTTQSGQKIQANKAEILSTIPLVLSTPPKIKPKSTKNTFEAALHAAKNAGSGHPFATLLFFLGLLIAIVYLLRAKKAPSSSHRGIIGNLQSNGGKFD